MMSATRLNLETHSNIIDLDGQGGSGMDRTRVGFAAGLAALSLLSLAVAPPLPSPGQGSRVPVISLANFTSVSEWQLDITWTAKDAFENADFSATLDMAATARLYLKQADKRDDWGRWHVEKVHSANLSIAGLLVNKHDHSRTEYKNDAGRPVDGSAVFEVGGRTPGYQVNGGFAYPVKLSNPMIGTIESLVTLLTTDISRTPPVFLTGPLPASGNRISGSAVIPMVVPPFGAEPVPQTRVGIQYVVQEVPLAPLVPPKKKK